MYLKEFMMKLARTYVILVTLITAAMLIVGLCAEPNARFGYEAYGAPLIYALFGTLPSAVMYSERELTVRALLVRKALQLILTEALILAVAFYNTPMDSHLVQQMLTFAVCIFIVYVLTTLIFWLQASKAARQMTEDLSRFQQRMQ